MSCTSSRHIKKNLSNLFLGFRYLCIRLSVTFYWLLYWMSGWELWRQILNTKKVFNFKNENENETTQNNHRSYLFPSPQRIVLLIRGTQMFFGDNFEFISPSDFKFSASSLVAKDYISTSCLSKRTLTSAACSVIRFIGNTVMMWERRCQFVEQELQL